MFDKWLFCLIGLFVLPNVSFAQWGGFGGRPSGFGSISRPAPSLPAPRPAPVAAPKPAVPAPKAPTAAPQMPAAPKPAPAAPKPSVAAKPTPTTPAKPANTPAPKAPTVPKTSAATPPAPVAAKPAAPVAKPAQAPAPTAAPKAAQPTAPRPVTQTPATATAMAAKPAKPEHGNSDRSTKPQHVYQIKDRNNPDHKTGISGGVLNKDGSSRRANTQVNQLNKANPVPPGQPPRYRAQVVAKDLPGRRAAKAMEQHGVNVQTNSTGKPPPGNTLPKPNGMYGPLAK